jgi:hypothetical protein
LWSRRRGHFVNATVNGFSFESSIAPRQKKFYLLIDTEAGKAAGVSAGVSAGVLVRVAVDPYVE